jgi:hypothetical protein
VDGAVISVDGEVLSTACIDANTLRATTLPHDAGAVEVRVTNPGSSSVSLPTGFHYVLRGTPVVDGTIDTNSGQDWDDAFFVGGNSVPPAEWGPNRLDAMYLAFDDNDLYLGLDGWVEAGAGNVIVVYLDVDFGPGTGAANMNDLTDNWGYQPNGGLHQAGIDDAISSKCVVTESGFGAEFAVGTKGMASIQETSTNPEEWVLAGLRGLSPPSDFPRLPATVTTTNDGPGLGAVEAAIPWTSLFAGGLPVRGTRMALFARLVNCDGQWLSDYTVPEDDPAAPGQVGVIFSFDVR